MEFATFCYAANKEAMREYRFPRTVISSVSEKSFSFAVKKKQESIGKWETQYSIRFEITSFHSDREKRTVNEKAPSAVLGRAI